MSINGENALFIYKTCCIWARRASGQENDLFLLLFRQIHLSTLLKREMQLIYIYGDFWIIFIFVCISGNDDQNALLKR